MAVDEGDLQKKKTSKINVHRFLLNQDHSVPDEMMTYAFFKCATGSKKKTVHPETTLRAKATIKLLQ